MGHDFCRKFQAEKRNFTKNGKFHDFDAKFYTTYLRATKSFVIFQTTVDSR